MIILFPLLMISCAFTTHEFRMYQGSIEENRENRYSRLEGDNTVLEVYHFSHNPLLPMAWGGYALFMETNKDFLREGETIPFPNDKIRIHLFKSLHHSLFADKELSGKMKIIEINPKYIVVELDVASVDSKWKLNEKGKFKLTEISKIK